jgi:hypothetical protein
MGKLVEGDRMRNYDDIPKEFWDDKPRRRTGGTNGNETGRTKAERSRPDTELNKNRTRK